MNKCILRVQGISSCDRPKAEKVPGFKNNHFFLRIRTGKGFSPLLNNIKNVSLYRILTCP